jgi:hypothetical protein
VGDQVHRLKSTGYDRVTIAPLRALPDALNNAATNRVAQQD